MIVNISECVDLMVVDAEEETYRPLLQALVAAGLNYQQAYDGHQALQIAAGSSARLWITNLHLPDMSGIELLQIVKATRPRTLFYLVSDQYSAQDEILARSTGAAGYLSKPANRNWLELCQTTLSRSSVRAGPSHAPS